MRRALLLVVLAACDGGKSPAAIDAEAFPRIDAPGLPEPSGCITDTSAGKHTFTCEGLTTDIDIPDVCRVRSCGVILELHGDTGTGPLMDAHTNLMALGEQNRFIVIAPTGPAFGGGQPGSTWHASNDDALVSIVQQVSQVFRADPSHIHVTGFSRGGFATWRLQCDHSELFVSSAPAGAGFGEDFGEVTCFENGRRPNGQVSILFLMGRTDASVGFSTMQAIRDAASDGAAATMLDGDATYAHREWIAGWGPLETFEHSYETVADGPWADAKGHCIPGSTMDPYAPQYAIPCKGPNSFVWGEQVMKFFVAHPRVVPD